MEEALAKTRKWLENIVIGLGLCPFAGKVYVDGQVGFKVLPYDISSLTEALNDGINQVMDESDSVTTHLIILSEGLENFNDFLDIYYGIEAELQKSGLAEDIQLANFHPEYQFTDVGKDDIQNYTNRSPYPVFHILRVDKVAAAIKAHPDIEGLPAKNIEIMKKLGLEGIMKILK